ncbi:hypothetical protein C1I98_31250 [Spongiactinospora gelatinilytica]|uniref:Tetratricopeptide repeat protein n=1 Tax=Spongiactinospora gelatinilytica TaxID=2666298 RepID=A0A2W2G072_9ACTN|nr:hypothetical protein C1I98_31250 [Spongiactinospora gelatinilytica]
MPEVAADITADELDSEIREELGSLPGDLADLISRHLVAAERALGDDDPERAYEHAKVARRFAARIGVVREAAGVTAYRAGQFSEALGDLRAARRMTGSDEYLPIMADCERGLGRPERALDLVRSREAERLDRAGRIELTIVESGARRDLGQLDAALVTLQRLPELRDPRPHPWSARLAFAYADALAEAGHEAAAADWFGRAMGFDDAGETDAAARYSQLTGESVADIEDIEEGVELDAVDAESAEGVEQAEDEEIDDLAALDRQIEDEDDLDELDFEEQAPPAESAPFPAEPSGGFEDVPDRGTVTEPAKKDDGPAERKIEVEAPAVPAFIAPDFGDLADEDPDDDESDADGSDEEAPDAGEPDRETGGEQGKRNT